MLEGNLPSSKDENQSFLLNQALGGEGSQLCILVLMRVVCRFIYARYALGLLKDGIRLLHIVTLLVVTSFCINGWHWVFSAIQQDDGYNYSLKGQFCNKEM